MSNQRGENEKADELDQPTPGTAKASTARDDGQTEQAPAATADFEAGQPDRSPPPTSDERVLEAEREVLRARAELENFRKRMQREADQQLKYSNLPLLRDLLDVVDNLNRAMQAARSESASAPALLSGVEMVSQQLEGVLAKYGCKPVEAVGKEFDPNVHEAISQMSSEEHPPGAVSQEVAVGYVLHDRVIRPSSVIVSTGPAAK